MNRGIHRLIFDPRRAMLVPVAESVRARRSTAAGSGRLVGLCALLTLLLPAALWPRLASAARPLPSSATQAPQANLPQAAAQFNQLGRATQAVDATNPQRLLVEQQDQRVILNWSSFDIGRDHSVRFNQPTGGSALNRIGGSSPSVILGSLEANGELILYNANGVLFGSGATVSSGNFIATTLNIADQQFEQGFRNITRHAPAFAAADGELEGFVRVEAGASIAAASGGDIMLFAPRLLNEGRLSAPGGQVALAAGQKVYLAASLNPSERGLLVEVDPFEAAVTGGDPDYNRAENAARGSTSTLSNGQLVQRVNEIVAERGSVSMVGLSVRQNGTVRATTAVKGQNGAIRLLAHGKTVSASHSDGITGHTMATASEFGELVVGPQSVTRIDADTSSATQLDAEPFYNSTVSLEGKQIHLQGGAQIIAPGAGGVTPAADAQYPETRRGVTLRASATPLSSGALGVANVSSSDDSRIVIDPGVLIDVSGNDVDLPMQRNVLTGRLFSIQLADSPLQRTGVLYRQEISFDLRKGLSIADVDDFYGQIGRTAAERLTAGGRIDIRADGAVVIGEGATLDFSGGSLRYAGGEIRTTQLRKGNQLVDISAARPDVVYDQIMPSTRGRYEPGYVEGRNAGELTLVGRQLLLDGTLRGGVQLGRYQRGGPAGASPLAGRLQLGMVAGPAASPDHYLSSVLLAATGGERVGADFFANPFTALLPAARTATTTLSSRMLMAGGLGRIELLANDRVQVAADSDLDLGPGGSFTATARRIEVEGRIQAAAGSITLNARPTILTGATPAPNAGLSVLLAPSARLDTAGRWSNDALGTLHGTTFDAPVAVGGGSIKVAAYDSVLLAAGAALDVSAGAWRSATGKVSQGAAGAIDLAANVGNGDPLTQSGTVQLAGSVTGYGFAGGGRLTLSSLEITVADLASGGLWLMPAFFSDHGFETIDLRSIDDLLIADGTRIDARLRNRVLDIDAADRPSGTPISALSHFAAPGEQDEVANRPVNLNFAATRLPSASAGITGANLQVGRGASVATTAGGALSFSAGNSLTVAGTLQALGGTIDLSIEGVRGGSASDPDKIGFLPAQALWLTDTARLLAGGTAEQSYSPLGLRSGVVHGGGTVTLNANRGYLLAEAGSLIDLSGHETTFDLYAGRANALISRDAGSLTLASPEGILFDATLRAMAPSPHALGGRLALSISRQGLDNFTEGTAYPTGERKILLQRDGTVLPAGLHPGDVLDLALGNGVAALSAAAVESAGFASVRLRADDRIEFTQDVAFATARALELDSRVISAQGSAAVLLEAPYLRLGDSDIQPVAGMAAPTAAAGMATLTAHADLIDLVGTLGLQGFSATQLNAARHGLRQGEIRLHGAPLSGTAQRGALLFAGTLDLTAGQITPTTFSTFDITGLSGDSLLRTHAPVGGSTAALPLSAFGSLRLSADAIEHGGVIRAPFGRLELAATNRLELLDGSELSLAGSGLTVPVGTTVNGSSWNYFPLGTAAGNAELFRTITALPVDRQVLLNGGTMAISAGARVSAAGGGAVQAAEFIAGAGGSIDYLASTPGLHAVLPGYSFGYAPHDAQIQAGTDLLPGEQIVITMAGSALAPGRYTLLPAAYALLPGAVLVSRAADQGSSALDRALLLSDGSRVVTGYRTVAGTAAMDDLQRYLVEPAATFRAKAEYRLVSGDDFFSGQAARLGGDPGRLTRDAGRISLVANQLLDWKALFDLSAPLGGRAGEFDLVLPNIVLTREGEAASAGHTAADGYTQVSIDRLMATGAGSILLGGTRSGDGVVSITTGSERVRVESGLQLNELLLAARRAVEVADDVDMSATGRRDSAAGQLNLSGDGALLRISNRMGVDLVRSGVARAAGFGDLLIGANTTFNAAQVEIDATGSLTLDSSARLFADAFGLGAGRIAFSAASPEGDGVVIEGALLDSVRGASSLSLRSYSTIDFLDSLDLALVGSGRLLLDAASLRGLGDADDVVHLRAGEVLLRNSSGGALAAQGQGRLTIEAQPPLRDRVTGGLELGGGSQALGFDQVTLSSAGDLIFSGSGQLTTLDRLDLLAQRLTTTTAADHTVTAGGVLTIGRPTAGHSLNERVGLGGKLTLTGQQVFQHGTIDLPGGQISLIATNSANAVQGIELSAGSITRAGGFATTLPQGGAAFGDAGWIDLIARQGAILIDGRVSVAAQAGGGHAGRLSLSAIGSDGTLILGDNALLEGEAGDGGAGGSFSADLMTLPDDAADGSDGLDGVAAATGDFSHLFNLRVGGGDVALNTGQVKAGQILISADAGSLTIGSTLDARAARGGVVQLSARDALTLANGGRILANSTRAGANGGDVLLSSSTGRVTVAAGAAIDAGGDDDKDGRVVLRAERSGTTVKVDPIAGVIDAAEVSIEALRRYVGSSIKSGTTLGAAIGQSTLLADITSFMANKSAILTALGVATDPRFHLRPGVEVTSSADLTLTNDWNLYAASRPGGEPGFLTLRAAGNLNLSNNLSDGFNGLLRTSLLQAGDAWSMRLVGGADLAAANPLAVNRNPIGDLTLAGGKLLRTSSGSIELAAGRDIVLGGTTTAPATVMVTGTASTLAPALAAEFTTPANALFTAHGGRLTASAGRDIRSPVSDQTLINNWFWRSGRLDAGGNFSSSSLAWWSRLDLFRHGFGSFGGGNILLSAGRNLQDVGAFAPSSARMTSRIPDASKLLVENGGDVEVLAGGDIAGGSFFVGRGQGLIRAAGEIGSGTALNSTIGPLAPVLALNDGGWTLRGRSDVAITAAFNPTIMVPNSSNSGSFFYSYGSSATLNLASTAGDFHWQDLSSAGLNSLRALPTGTGTLNEDLVSFVPVTTPTPYIAPPRVEIMAHAADVVLSGNRNNTLGISLYPSALGSLVLHAGGDLFLNSSLRMMDNRPADLAGVTNPVFTATNSAILGLVGSTIGYDINKLLFTDLHQADSNPVRIDARGSLNVVDGKKLIMPKQALLSAGQDILNLTLFGQHHRSTDVTLIEAGRNLLNTTLLGNNGLISLAGPGRLEISAGRQLNLGASAGVETVGNLYNDTLPVQGAAVQLAASQAATLDAQGLDQFLSRYLAASGAPSGADYRNALVDQVRQTLGQGSEVEYGYDDALALFRGFGSEAQVAFIQQVLAQEFANSYLQPGQTYAAAWAANAAAAGVAVDHHAGSAFEQMRREVMFNEIRLAGIAGAAAKGAAAKEAGYAPGYRAIELAGHGAPFGFVGGIDLSQSKVQTKSGGGIDFVNPGGGVNVGLSAEVSNVIGQAKSADQRGVVTFGGGGIRAFTDGDFLVNAQKVFVIGSGDILLWSSNGNIDSGKGSNNTVTVPPLVPKVNPLDGSISFELPTLATGSGIGILAAAGSSADGAAYLFAPRGEVIALDAFIRAPVIFFDPEKIRGADNALGVAPNPVSAPAVPTVTGFGSSATQNSEAQSRGSEAPQRSERERSSILTVEVLALGEMPAAAGGATGPEPATEGDPDERKKKKSIQ